jgi:deoxyribodipyrimidine photo-lyase
VLLTRDLRVHDNPALHAAVASSDRVVPMFVVDSEIDRLGFNRPNRARFLADSLTDLDQALRERGGHLVVRRGDVAREVASMVADVAATDVHMSADYSRYAATRDRRLRDALGDVPLHTHDGVGCVAPEAITTGSGGPYTVFSAYHRRWVAQGARPVHGAPTRVQVPSAVTKGTRPTAAELCPGQSSPDLMPGGESTARRRAKAWFDGPVEGYDDGHDALADDATSRLSPYLHFGCISPNEIVARADRRRRGVAAFLRQLAWRDFYLHVLAARPDASSRDLRSRGDRWRDDDELFQAWQDGRTGYPLVDAGMRQLKREGWMHNRARLVAGSFLTKHLYLDWRLGARHFFDHLVDGDIANNCLNWQWVAGTGTDSRPNRILNPVLQQQRYDPEFRYISRYVEEFGTGSYPAPIVDHADAVAAFRAARSR